MIHIKKLYRLAIQFSLFVILNLAAYAQSPVLYPNFPKLLDTTTYTTAGREYIPLITDLEKDGQKEIVLAIVKGYPNSLLFVIKSDGSHYPGFPKTFNSPILNMASGDVNGDGNIDIAIRFLNSIGVIDRFGNFITGFPVNYNSQSGLSHFISLYDLDNDNKLEIIVSRLSELSVFDYNGQVRNGWPKYLAGQMYYNPAIGDIDNDGFAEIIYSSFKLNPVDSGVINILRHNGNSFSANWPKYLDSSYIMYGGSPSLYIDRIHPDSTLFCISVSHPIQQPYTINRYTKYLLNGNILYQNFQTTISGLGTFAIADVNGDSILEFASGSQFSGYTSLYSDKLKIMNGWPNLGHGEHAAPVLIGKLTNGMNLNIITNTSTSSWGTGYGYIFSYNPDGTQSPFSAIRPKGLVSAFSLDDMNNDGAVELIALVTDLNKLSLQIFSFPGIPFSKYNFPWPQFGHDRYRTNQYGFIPPDEPIGIQPISNQIPNQFSLSQNYPNPFNPSTKISFDVSKKSFVELIIFDILGRRVRTLLNQTLDAGKYKIDFNASEISSGIYFYSLRSENFSQTKKMILIK